MGEQLTFKASSYVQIFQEGLRELKDFPELSDVTLISEDQVLVKAHKLILSMFSPVLRSFLSLSTEGNTVIHLRGTRGTDIQSLLDYFHYGEVTLERENVSSFLDLANSFKIKHFGKEENKNQTFKEKRLDKTYIDKEKESIPHMRPQNGTEDLGIENQEDIKERTCPKCAREFTKRSKMVRHLSVVHSTKVFECTEPGCEAKFKEKSERTRHIKCVHGPPRLKCDECDQPFKYLGVLKKHVDSVHKKIRQHCNECELDFANTSALKIHKESKHLNIKYPCHICGYQATQKTSLKVHIIGVHEKGKYPCHVCGKSFSQKGTLNNHLKGVHN